MPDGVLYGIYPFPGFRSSLEPLGFLAPTFYFQYTAVSKPRQVSIYGYNEPFPCIRRFTDERHGEGDYKLEVTRTIKAGVAVEEYHFSSLVDEYGDRLYRFCRNLTYTREDAEDLFQETFSKAFELLPKLAVADSPQSFLFSTALYIWSKWPGPFLG